MTTTAEFIKNAWKGETLEAMKNFIRIPSKSSAFEADWEVRGELLRAVRQAESWGHQRFPEGIFDVLQKPCIPPALYIDLPSTPDVPRSARCAPWRSRLPQSSSRATPRFFRIFS